MMNVLVVPWASSAVKTANCCASSDCIVVLNVQLGSLGVDCRCCGPVGRCLFPESRGSPRPAAPPWRRVVLSPPRMVGFIGALVSSFAQWAQFALGIVPRRVLCAAGGGAAVYGRLACGETRQRAKIGSQCNMRVQVKCACVRPNRGSLTSHQDRTRQSMFGKCPPSTVHLQSTLICL